MADGPRISDSFDPRALIPHERAVVGGALRSQGRQNKNGQQHVPGPTATRPWFRAWPALVAAGAIVALVLGAVAIAAARPAHKTPAALVRPTIPSDAVSVSRAPISTPAPPSAVVLPAPATTAAQVIPTLTVASAPNPVTVRWRVVAVVRSLGPVPAKQGPFDVIDDAFASLRPGQKFTAEVSCTPIYCLPPPHTFVTGETLAYWGLAGAGDGVRAAPLAFSQECRGNTFAVQPGFASTLTRVSATSYTSRLSRPARSVLLQCQSQADRWRGSSFVVDRTITRLP
jgi:hypothetical protein